MHQDQDVLAVKIVGLGGIGSILARYVAVLLAARPGPSRLVLIDGDAFEPRNSERAFFNRIGNKASVVREEIASMIGGSRLTVLAAPEYITPDNVERLLRSGDVVLLAVDNHATRRMVSDHAATLDDVSLISGGNDGVGPDNSGRVRTGTYGNVQVYVRRGARDITPSLTEFHPEIAEPADRLPGGASCAAAVFSTPQLLVANLQAAAAMVGALWALSNGNGPDFAEVCFDVSMQRMQPLPFRRKPARDAETSRGAVVGPFQDSPSAL